MRHVKAFFFFCFGFVSGVGLFFCFSFVLLLFLEGGGSGNYLTERLLSLEPLRLSSPDQNLEY